MSENLTNENGQLECVECGEKIIDGLCCSLFLHDYEAVSNTVYLHTGQCYKDFDNFLKSNTAVYQLEEVCNFLEEVI